MKYIKYLWYLIRHKWFVMIECFKEGLVWQGIVHDLDKFRWDSFKCYSDFMGSDRFTTSVPESLYARTGSREMNKVWLRHRKINKHHWQYYCYGRKEPRQMPYRYVVEMVCDWKGAMKAHGVSDLKAWYLYSRDSMVLHEHTRRLLNKLIGV
jgi:hypothetical protein